MASGKADAYSAAAPNARLYPFAAVGFIADRETKSRLLCVCHELGPGLSATIIDSIVNKGDVCFDIGANIGVYTCVLGLISGAGTNIHAFEPADHIRRKLHRNLQLNGLAGVSANSFALGAAETESKFFEVKEGTFRGGVSSFVRNENIDRMKESNFTERRVQVRMLDNYVSEASPPRINFLKIDVEGFELEVLRGGIRTIDRFRPFILMEYDEIRHRKDAAEMLSMFKDLHYEALEPFLERGKLGFSRWSFDRTPKERNVLLMP